MIIYKLGHTPLYAAGLSAAMEALPINKDESVSNESDL